MAKCIGGLRVLLVDGQEMAGLGALRSLGRAAHRVRVSCSEQVYLPPASLSRYAAHRVPLRHPDPWRRQFAFRDWLLAQARSGAYDVILPITEASILAAAALRPEVPAGVVLLIPDERSLRFSLSKYHTTRAAQSIGVPVPRTVFISDGSLAAVHEPEAGALAGLRYPLVVKIDNELLPDGTYRKGSAVRVDRPEEALAVLAGLQGSRAGVIVQEHFRGSGAGVFLLRQGGEVVLRFGHRRLHEVPHTGGFSSLRQSDADPALLAQAERLLAAVGYEGVAMVEFRRDEQGVPRLLEINGRLWGSLALALHAGVDFPRRWLEGALARPLAPPRQEPYRVGLLCRNIFPGELLHVESVLRAPELPAADKRRALRDLFGLTLRRGIRHDFLWREDPLPGLWQAARSTAQLATRLGQLWARRRRAARDRRLIAELGRPARIEAFVRGLREAGPGARLVFVCHGNICRSPFAAAYWNRLLAARGGGGPEAVSAGLDGEQGRSTPARIVALARSMEVDLGAHRSQPLSAALLEGALVVVMDGANLRALRAAFPGAAAAAVPLGAFMGQAQEIADPYLLEPGAAMAVYRLLGAALEGLAARSAPLSEGRDGVCALAAG